MDRALRIAGTFVLGMLALAGLWFLGMRRKDSAVVALQRRINRAVVNPRQMRTAGTAGAYAGLVRHVGRSSGRPYQTPVGIVPTADGFVVALMYGARSDWVQNVLAAGSATIVQAGVTYAVDRPEIVALATAVDDFPASERRGLRLFGVQECLRLRITPPAPASRPDAAGS